MAYLRILLITNLVLAGLFMAEKVQRWWSHPGNWSATEIAAELKKDLKVDELVLSPHAEGGYAGDAMNSGRLAFRVRVQQDPAEYSMHWSATPPQGRSRSGSQASGPGRMSKDSWLFVLYVNVAVAAMICGSSVAARFRDRRKRDLIGYVGIPLFLAAMFAGSAFSETRLGGDLSWQEMALKWGAICLLFFAVGLFSRHMRNMSGSREKTQSQRERAAEEAAEKRQRG